VIYVVHRIGWDRLRGVLSPIVRESRQHSDRTQGRPVGAFTDRQQAEAFRCEQECLVAQARAAEGIDPFAYVSESLDEMTSMDEGAFADLVSDLGLEPPDAEDGERDWGLWFDMNQPLTAEQLAAIWRHADRIQFLQIVEVPLS
jgi:hypothetical protein